MGLYDEAYDIIQEWGEENRILLINKYNELGLRASGQWAESLTEGTEQKGGAIIATMVGEDYTGALTDGRSPNRDQSDAAIRAWVGWAGSTFLDDWVKDKGLSINPYAVAYKIAREGWEVPNPHNAGGLLDVVNAARIQIAKDRLGEFFTATIGETMINNLKS